MTITEITRKDVLEAIAEFDLKGIENTLDEYDFKEAKRYYLLSNRKSYPSKAVLEVAHKYARLDIGPLKASEFSGDRDTVQKKLEQLRFQVFVGDLTDNSAPMFEDS